MLIDLESHRELPIIYSLYSFWTAILPCVNDLLDISMNLSIWSIWEGKKETNDICSNIINNFTNLKEKSHTL